MTIFESFKEALQTSTRTDLLFYGAAFIGSFIICLVLIPVIIKLSVKHNLLDKPNERKVHKSPISRLGGFGIVAGLLSTSAFWFFSGNISLLIYLLAGIFILLIIGIIDDLKELSPRIKFIGQILAALLMAYAGLRINNLFGVFGIHDLPVFVQYLLTVFIVVGLINAYNLIDGIDGLAGGLALIDMVFFFVLFLISNEITFVLIMASTAGALLAFLKYNWNPARIFMGDTGSMVLGFLLSAAGIKLMVSCQASSVHFTYSAAAIMAFSIFLLPVYDLLRVSVGRIIQRKSPFSADKTHVHHLLMDTGLNHKKSAKILYVANIAIIVTGFLLRTEHFGVVAPLLFLEGALFMEFLTLYKIFKTWLKIRKISNKTLRMKVDNRLLIDNIEEKDERTK
jgi:UDP-N-acetylmuramyl pentapeptide phosphotransferase/UDP-N-acetylglucosamine-1-phosphate transferase